MADVTIVPSENGPYIVTGSVKLVAPDGHEQAAAAARRPTSSPKAIFPSCGRIQNTGCFTSIWATDPRSIATQLKTHFSKMRFSGSEMKSRCVGGRYCGGPE